jgi:ribosomal protein S6--L-glutamate ligase
MQRLHARSMLTLKPRPTSNERIHHFNKSYIMKIAILSNSSQALLTKTLKAKGHEVILLKPNQIYLYVSEYKSGYDRVYVETDNPNEPERLTMKGIDAIIPRISGADFEYACAVVRHFEDCLGLYSTGTSLGLTIASNKFWTSQKLSEAKVKQPVTVFADSPQHPKFLIDLVGGLPAIGKLPRGSQGKQVFIMESEVGANTTLQTLYSLKQNVIIQQFIESGAKDIRAIVIGDKVVSAMERKGKNDFRANLSQGGTGRDILNELTETEKANCVKCAKALGLDFAGVDFIRLAPNNCLFLEVNGNSGEKIIGITERNHYEDLIKLIESKVKRSDKEVSTNSQAETEKEVAEKIYNGLKGKSNMSIDETAKYLFSMKLLGKKN